MKKLKIISCTDSMLWYSKCIGHEVAFLGEDMDFKGPIYWSRDRGGYKNIVFQKDAIIIGDENEQESVE